MTISALVLGLKKRQPNLHRPRRNHDEKLDPVTPSEILLEEFLVPMGLSQYRLAKEIDVPAQRIREIIAGKRAITADKDLRLCKFFGLSSGYWLRAQVSHDTEVAEREMGPTLKRIIPWVANTTHSARQKTPPRLVVEALPRQSPALQNFRSLPGINAVDQYISQRMEPRVGISQPNKFTNEKRPD